MSNHSLELTAREGSAPTLNRHFYGGVGHKKESAGVGNSGCTTGQFSNMATNFETNFKFNYFLIFKSSSNTDFGISFLNNGENIKKKM